MQATESGQERAPGRKPGSDSEMQGQPLHHENQNTVLGSTSTTTTMEEQPQQPAVPSAAPQIRARITVVCAECKRLKLKCDRRTPCGSCTKRDTVSRCIYSPAAAEKVDLHSLNNRLIQVEAILAMVTAGKTPPPFQSSYPLAQVALPTTLSTKPRATHTIASSPATSISIQLNDLMNIWLAHCQLDLFPHGNQTPLKAAMPSDGAYVKLEPSPIETLQLASPYHQGNTIIIDEGPSNIMPTLTTGQHNLPPLHMYYPAPQQQESQTGHYTYPSQNPYPTEYDTPFPPQREYEFPAGPQRSAAPPPASTRPAASPALLALLPPPSTRTKLLANARSAHPHLALLVQWSKITDLADPDAALVKGRQKALACAIFFGVRPGSPAASSSAPPAPASVSTCLPLFTCLCYILALGALEPSQDTSVDHAFLYALAGQAMNVWEEWKTSTEAREEEAKNGGSGEGDRRMKMATKEKEETNILVASLLQVKYLLRSGSSTMKNSSTMLATVFPLIGRLVNSARGLGLTRDPEEESGPGLRRSAKAEERRRMIWWDIMFYDAFMSDALHHTPLVASHSYTTKSPAIAQSPSSDPSNAPSNSSSRKYSYPAEDSADGGDDSDPSCETADVDRPTITKGRAAPRFAPSRSKGKGRVFSTHVVDDIDNGFFGVRCCLTRLAQTVKHRLSHPACDCCTCGNGYSLDQAAKLEAEIRAWVADLPASLKLELSAYSPSSAQEDSKRDLIKSPKHAALAAELAIIANRMIISAYLPLMRTSSDAPSSSSAYSAAHPWSPASRATVEAAQGVIRAARVVHRLSQAGNTLALLGDYYPLEKAVVDALVICAHSAFATGKLGRPVMEEVALALEVLGALGTCEGELGRIVGSLRKRVEACEVGKRGEENVLKRKHIVLEGGQGEQGDKTCASRGMGMAVDLGGMYGKMGDGSDDNVLLTPLQQHQQHRPVPQPPTPQRNGTIPRPKGSDKKNTKKSYPVYPAIGVRDRGKEGAPWMAKRSSMTPSKPDADQSGDIEARMNDMTSKPTSEGGTNFQSSNASQRLPSGQPMLDTGYRSRSSSITQPPRLQATDYLMQYGGSEDRHSDMHTHQRRRFSIHDNGQHQPQEQTHMQQPFAVSPTSLYNPSQQSSRAGSFDAPRGFDQPRGSFDQNAASAEVFRSGSSPYQNSSAPISTASSPYGSATGHPHTPTFSTGSHRPSPPIFGPQATVASPQTYYHIPSNYDAGYDGHAAPQHQQQQVLGVMAMDTSMGVQQQADCSGAMGAPPSVPPTPLYEKSQQSLYDLKPPLDLAQQQQQQQQALRHYQVASGRTTPVDAQHHMSMNPSTQSAWSSTPQYMQPQPITEQHGAQYWNTDVYYR
ncbi:hypothetical protein D9615_003248 [Tricholomella constricta]|uniref:Zn(2)-C6 fungal-type domain-containing protein n=1 Tax=Tricholomella constricta TaxID=117010 RepID=A0A8H5M7Z6_9AGAR|nr:hypothetical protein D9615_003248 [Tricholomella constricta]